MRRLALTALVASLVVPSTALAKKDKAADAEKAEEEGVWNAGTFTGLSFRSLGPAQTSGRISDIAVDPDDHDRWFVAVASGNLWRTSNHGTTFEPIFDDQGSYSIGCVTIDPNDGNVIWVGTGENNSQRSVSYGDGVYRSVDGGSSWEHMGLKESEHIGMIRVDPRDSKRIFVAAQGPLWRTGGDRGLYLSEDGGETWELVLEVDEDTGANEVHFDPRDPDVMYASTYQRRRRVWTLIDGGPGSGVWKSADGGRTWNELTSGLPATDMGKIGLAVAASEPDTVYAIVEAARDESGFYRSTDAGATWEKMSDYVSGSPQYYNEIFVDPSNADRVYSMDTWLHVTDDAGASFRMVGEATKHVDNHAMWIDPADSDHFILGCDGGVYESWDRGATWHYKDNLPVTQFYKIAVDDREPFYHVYGGTQDNATLGGPSRTTTTHGIRNSDWYVTVFGDGFESVVEPGNPDIVYSQWQYGGLVRYDHKTGEMLDIKPQPAPGEEALRFNWDSGLIISPHSPTRLYFGAQKLFRSDDRGHSWTAVSGDLTRDVDRNAYEVMGEVWSVDAVAKNKSTSFYGTIVAVDESPLVEGLLYVGTDDGLIQVSEDGGETWREVAAGSLGAGGHPNVSDLTADLHDADTVYAALDRHKDGNFTPYLYRSTDRGRTWTSISGDLPERGNVHTVVQDHEKAELLFAGTELGVYFSPDGGDAWVQLKGGIPTISVEDLEIQRRENDLVVGTFGRGFYVLDDYSPLRLVTETMLEEETAALFPVRDAHMFIERSLLGIPGKAFQGDSFFTAPNPPFGAVATIYMAEGLKTLEAERHEEEDEAKEEGEPRTYPSWDELRAEDREEDPRLILEVRDEDDGVVRRLTTGASKGFQRVAWDLRYPAPNPVELDRTPSFAPWAGDPEGPLAAPGRYTMQLLVDDREGLRKVSEPVSFEARPLSMYTIPPKDWDAAMAFQDETAELQRAVLGSVRIAGELDDRIAHMKQAVLDTPKAYLALLERLRELDDELTNLQEDLTGDTTVASRNEPTPPSIADRVGQVVFGHWSTTTGPTETHRQNYRWAAEAFADLLPKLKKLGADVEEVEEELEAAGAPWTPQRDIDWQGL